MILNDICEFIVDCPHTTAPDEGAGYPLIRTPNIGKGRLVLNGVHRVSEKVYRQRIQRGMPQDNDLIFAREAPAGNVAIVKNGEKVCLGQRTVLLRPDKSKVCPDYLVYYILAPAQQYKLLGTANGATVAHVNLPVIRNMPVELPPLEVQEIVAGYLSAYDNLIENNQKQIKLLEEAAQRLYKEWFVDLRFPGYEDTPIVDGVPEGWADGTLGDIAVFKRGKTITKAQVSDGNIPVVAGGLEPAYYHNKANTTAPLITVSASGANAGFTRLYNIDVFASDCSYIDSNSTPFLLFVYCFLKTNAMKLNSLQKGSAQPHVYAKDLNALVLSVPSEGVLTAFCGIVSPYFERIRLLQRENEIAAQARDRMLPKLMSGEIEV
ncbi:type I restriction modification DNA specificity domain protein [[Eubacterium] siraeum DSM 15702]|uniref:Type I restriction modification DNA specificity domain protein n=1 Tax=[Eubacterium] siraeum DSM 15702 TaxID=428128 RepID=B0MMJ8_9FIRM|nr:type I restriction modification DNA specificity domain protein [[Eubacterium] siraeum DSM 15702]UWP24824.1 restriction endonuclease subunit S [[Eubacterium] siraeum]